MNTRKDYPERCPHCRMIMSKLSAEMRNREMRIRALFGSIFKDRSLEQLICTLFHSDNRPNHPFTQVMDSLLDDEIRISILACSEAKSDKSGLFYPADGAYCLLRVIPDLIDCVDLDDLERIANIIRQADYKSAELVDLASLAPDIIAYVGIDGLQRVVALANELARSEPMGTYWRSVIFLERLPACLHTHGESIDNLYEECLQHRPRWEAE
jgi:hypothetical protein